MSAGHRNKPEDRHGDGDQYAEPYLNFHRWSHTVQVTNVVIGCRTRDVTSDKKRVSIEEWQEEAEVQAA